MGDFVLYDRALCLKFVKLGSCLVAILKLSVKKFSSHGITRKDEEDMNHEIPFSKIPNIQSERAVVMIK